MHPPTGRAPKCQDSQRSTTQVHESPHRGKPLEKFGPQPTTNIPQRGDPWQNFAHKGRPTRTHPELTSVGTHLRGRRVCLISRKGRGDRGATLGPYTPPTPNSISTQDTTPFTSTSKGVGQPRVQWLPHGRTSSLGVGSIWAIGCRRPCLRSRTSGSGGGGSGSGATPPFTCRTLREGCSALANPPLLCIQSDGRYRPPSLLGGGGPREGAHGGACHPQLDLVEGDLLLPADLQGGGHFSASFPILAHIWELPGNYPVFTVVMVIYHYVERIRRILVTPIFKYNIYDH